MPSQLENQTEIKEMVSYEDKVDCVSFTSSSKSPHLAMWFDPIFLFCVFVISASTFSPIAAAWSFTLKSWPCANHACQPEMYTGIMASMYIKFLIMVAIGLGGHYVGDVHLRYNRGKQPIVASLSDMELNREVHRSRHLFCILGAICDVSATFCEREATYWSKPSTVSLIGNTSVLVAALGRVVVNKEALMVCEVLGILLLLTGGCYFASLDSIEGGVELNSRVGIILSFVGSVCRGLHYTVHQKLFTKYNYPALKYIGIEASFSLFLTVLLSITFNSMGVMSVVADFYATVSNPLVLLAVFLFSLGAGTLNPASAVAGKYISGLYRILVLRMAGVAVWVWEILFQYGDFSLFGLLSNIFIVLGSLVFGGVGMSLDKTPALLKALDLKGRLNAPVGSSTFHKRLASMSSSTTCSISQKTTEAI